MKAVKAFAAALTLCGVQAAHAETRALLLGVSHYGSPIIQDLAGPANDLVAMDKMVRALGATDIVNLQDAQVSRSSAEAALQTMGARAKAGDWIILYYSGHGAQAVARVQTVADGAFDQFLPLAGFDPAHQNPERFIVDKDFYAWLKRYISPDVHIMMLVDTCHSGTMHRAVNERAFGFTSRLAFRNEERSFELVERPGPQLPALAGALAEASTVRRDDLPNLVYIGASRDDQLALEVALPQEGAPSRGILTYAFETGLSLSSDPGGSRLADLDGDGRISVLEISSYLNSQVRLLTAQRQESTAFFPPAWSDLPILSSLPPPHPLEAIAPMTVALLHGPSTPPTEPLDLSWRTAAAGENADFFWDVPKGEVLRRSGDLVASGVSDQAALTGVVGKWRAVQTLTPFVAELNTRLRVSPGGGDIVYPPHQKLSVEIMRTEQGTRERRLYATVFNLASDGTVQLLYPLAPDGDGIIRTDNMTTVLENEVVQPFGTDHVVALTTPYPTDDLRGALRALDGKRVSGSLATLVAAQLTRARGAGSFSIVEIYTGR